MADDLWVSGGGTTAVSTDELYATAQALGRLATSAAELQARVRVVDRGISMDWLAAARAPRAAAQAELEIDQAVMVLIEIEVQARLLAWSLNTAADGYGWVESFLGGVGESLLGAGAALAGSIGPSLALSNPVASLGAVTGVGMLAPFAFGPDQNSLVTNAGAASAVRSVTMASDEALLGAAGVSVPLATALGALGLTSGLSAGAAMRGGSLVGAFTETPVAVAATRTSGGGAPPAGYVERLARIPEAESMGDPQVRIEKYEMPDGVERFEVYVAGTVTFDPIPTTEPWDMTSNMAGARGEGSGSYESVRQAMALAGVTAESPVQFTGYSQGGGVVARLAASGEYTTVGLLSFGGPTGQIPIPDTVNAVIVEHRDDIVPALGGTQLNRDALIVERDVFEGREIPADYAVPAHHREYYVETAGLMDAARSDQVTRAIGQLDAFAAGATRATTYTYTFERQQPD